MPAIPGCRWITSRRSSLAPTRSTPMSSSCSATMWPVIATSRASFRSSEWAPVLAGLKAPLGVHADHGQSRLLGRQDGAARRARADSRPSRAGGGRDSGLRKRRRASHQGRPSLLARGSRRSAGLSSGAALSADRTASAPTISRARLRKSPTMRRSSCWRTSLTSRCACPRGSRCNCPAIPMAARFACSAGRRRYRRSTACGSPMVTSG